MTIKIKINGAEYQIIMDNISMTAQYIYIGKDKDGNPKKQSTNLGYYGPGQVDKAIDRIIGAELARNEDVVNLREFLRVYKGIHEIIQPQLVDLKNAIKEQRLLETN